MPGAIAEAMNQPPSEVCRNIIAFQNAHEGKALEHLPVYVKVFEDTFESSDSSYQLHILDGHQSIFDSGR